MCLFADHLAKEEIKLLCVWYLIEWPALIGEHSGETDSSTDICRSRARSLVWHTVLSIDFWRRCPFRTRFRPHQNNRTLVIRQSVSCNWFIGKRKIISILPSNHFSPSRTKFGVIFVLLFTWNRSVLWPFRWPQYSVRTKATTKQRSLLMEGRAKQKKWSKLL